MLRWLSLSMLVSLGGVALACGSSGSSGGSGDGCTPGSSCNTCSNCYELCICSTGSDQGCQVACDMTGTGGAATGGTGGGYPVGGTGGGGTSSGGSGGTTPTGGLATAVSISEIAIFQGVKVSLMNGGNTPAPNAPVVADREATIRVYVNPQADYQARELVARVELGGSAPGAYDAKAFIGGPSNDADGNSTLNVQIPPNVIKPDTTYKVSLLESAGSYPGSVNGAEWGAAPLGAQTTNGMMEVILVPVSINGIVPKTDATSIKAYHDRLMKLYPVPEVDIQVRAVAQYTGTTPQANGSGWNSLLNWLMQLRSYDKPPGKKYYYGVIAPASSFQTFCGFGCVAGLSSQTQAQDDPIYRVGSGVGFFPSGATPSSPDTMAHEVGHTAGLGHAPCVPPGSQIQGVDPNYPYGGASIGSWGWDLYTKNYLDPAKYKDMMSYCDPYIHVADWTFDKLFKRIAYTNVANDVAVPSDPDRAPGKYDSLLVNDDGSLEWGYPIDSPWWLKAEKKDVELTDGNGKVVSTVSGFWYPHDHGSGGTLLVRQKNLLGNPAAQTVQVAGATLSLAH